MCGRLCAADHPSECFGATYPRHHSPGRRSPSHLMHAGLSQGARRLQAGPGCVSSRPASRSSRIEVALQHAHNAHACCCKSIHRERTEVSDPTHSAAHAGKSSVGTRPHGLAAILSRYRWSRLRLLPAGSTANSRCARLSGRGPSASPPAALCGLGYGPEDNLPERPRQRIGAEARA